MKQLTKAILERALESELTYELGYEKHAPGGRNGGNSRNGKSSKTLKTDHGDLEIAVPRDRQGAFEPRIVKKGQRRFTGFDDKILSMYARGMTTRDIQGHLEEIYGVEVSPETNLDGYRWDNLRGKGMAEPSAGCIVSHCFF